MTELFCHHCQSPHRLDPTVALSRNDSCSSCGWDLRCCLNCQFYDANARWECREHISERVSQKEKANFCGEFRARSANGQQSNATQDLMAAAEALFKKK